MCSNAPRRAINLNGLAYDLTRNRRTKLKYRTE